jgi:hypothetical protein
MAGVMAGFGLWGSMFPIDTIKSKIQADSLSKPEFKGTLDCLRRSLSVEGHSGGGGGRQQPCVHYWQACMRHTHKAQRI